MFVFKRYPQVFRGFFSVSFNPGPMVVKSFFTWRVSDCEELVGVTLEEIMGIIQIKDSSKVPIFIWESMGIFEISESLGTVLLGSDQYH
jgi:hypothetical protein